jgi:hypothetical protein
VLGGMLVSTVMNLAIVPVLYVIVVNWSERKSRRGTKKRPAAAATPPPPVQP